MEQTQLNLARSWRSKTFDQIIGQPLSVRILQNSLFVNKFFPVYLFAGERGCGKTTTARVFASALNCEKLSVFQQDPKTNPVPCLSCPSCVAMLESKHPDFIEMDAASHTGVDNVRSIIDAATLLPVMGRKRVYLIDEAHMLSKAAFNAFLKILEEPPSSVIFMLATTDPHKIIDTVRSRCFQLFFNAIDQTVLYDHLVNVCTKEEIPHELDGLMCIARESRGLIRDALNVLEQVRFAVPTVTKEHVLNVLGHLDDERVAQVIDKTCLGDMAQLLAFLAEIKLESFDAQYVWDTIFQMVRIALHLSFGVDDGSDRVAVIKRYRDHHSPAVLLTFLQTMCSMNMLFTRSTQKHYILEMALMNMCKEMGTPDESVKPSGPQQVKSSEKKTTSVKQPVADQAVPGKNDVPQGVIEKEPECIEADAPEQEPEESPDKRSWHIFLDHVGQMKDQLVPSLLRQATFSFSDDRQELRLVLPERLSFFKDLLDENEVTLHSLCKKAFNIEEIVMNYVFEGVASSKPPEYFVATGSASVTQQDRQQQTSVQKTAIRTHQKAGKTIDQEEKIKGTPLDVSDADKWKLSNTLLKHFAGTVVELKQEVHDEQFA